MKKRTKASKKGLNNLLILLILTAVDQVKIHFNTENEEGLSLITVDEAKKYIDEQEFAKGSMLPKVEACIYFLNHSKKTKAIITSLSKAKEAISSKSGTTIIKGGE